MWPLSLALVVRFTLPAMSADSAGCAAGLIPLDDLAEVRLYGAPRYGRDSLLSVHPATVPGAADSFTVDLAGTWTLWVTSRDASGNESCPGAMLGLGLVAAVEPRPPPQIEWFDVLGRRIETPRTPGVYWRREAGTVRRLVVLR